jgi:kinesin family member 23
MQLLQIEKENIQTKTENASVRAILQQERQKSLALENKIIIHESCIDDLNRKLRDRDDQVRDLQRQLTQKQNMLSRKEIESEKERKKLTTKMNVENDMKKRELEVKLREQKQKMKEQMRVKDERLRAVSQIINADADTLRNSHFTYTENTPRVANTEAVNSVSHLASQFTHRTPKVSL